MLRTALKLSVLLYAASAFAQVQSVGDVSFAVPQGWKYEHAAGDDFSTLMLTSGDRFWVIAVYPAGRASGNADGDFAAGWKRAAPRVDVPDPIYSYAGTAGYSGRKGLATLSNDRFVNLYLLEAEGSAIPIMAITQNRRQFDDLEPVILQVVESVRISPARAEPIKTSVVIADLVGSWNTGGESSVNYVDSVTGSYAGSSTVAHGAGYDIAADGTYAYRFAGVTNRQVVRGQGSGTVEISKEFVAFKEKGTNRVTRYRTVSYMHAVNGATVLTLLPESYEFTGPNIGWYAEKWVRDAPKK